VQERGCLGIYVREREAGVWTVCSGWQAKASVGERVVS
jgi:hypothetical protein